jgi:L-cysteine S-thiosulfotransferase
MRLTLAILIALTASPALAQQKVDPARADAATRAAFPTAPADWTSRLTGDETMQLCSASRNSPANADAEAIRKREQASIVYPPDNNLVGDWKKGEALAQSGYGMRFTDIPARQANGGNCYACHQLTKKEVSYGTLGPSLSEYGKLRDFKPDAIKATYDKIYNSHAALPCSTMPRFGANRILTIEQIKDAVALLMSPESPVNTGQ